MYVKVRCTMREAMPKVVALAGAAADVTLRGSLNEDGCY
jgi:hypothetical protein